MQLSESQLHMIIIAVLAITVVLLGIHIRQMQKKENYEACILGGAANTNSVQDLTAPLSAQNLSLVGIDKRNATNIRENEQYYGNNSRSEFANGNDYLVGDNNKGVSCNNS